MNDLSIVTSSCGYGKYLREWAESILELTVKPGKAAIFTHGSESDREYAAAATQLLNAGGLRTEHQHEPAKLDFGTARNRAVEMSDTEWVMHFDADDRLMPHATTDIAELAPSADVIALGYERSGDLAAGPTNRTRVYSNTTGEQALAAAAPASGVSPFRRSLWERSPYRTDMLGAWDTALWIGFARLGARFRATKRPGFWYRQHADSVFNQRRLIHDWTHGLTVSQLVSLRRNDQGVAVMIPVDEQPNAERRAALAFVQAHYAKAHPEWPVILGRSNGRSWRKGDAIANALTHSTARTLVIADADCLVDPDELRRTVAAVEARAVPWAMPHDLVHRFDAPTTTAFMQGRVIERRRYTRPPYNGFAGGGIVVVPRPHYEATGGIPKCFVGWGCEDEALALVLDTFVGPHQRGRADLIHLWHPPQETKRSATGNRSALGMLRRALDKGGPAELWKALHGNGLRPYRPSAVKRVFTDEDRARRKIEQSYLFKRGAKKTG